MSIDFLVFQLLPAVICCDSIFLDMEVTVGQDDLEILQRQTREFIEKVNQKPIIRKARQRWEEYPPAWARYHLFDHTEDVLNETLFLAIADGITNERQLELLSIMATYHDIGMTMEPDNPDNLRQGHEKRGAQFVAEVMRESGEYSEEEIKIVVESIEDTEIKMREDNVLIQQSARHLLGKYLLDGDLGNLGREDFSDKSNAEFKELQLVLKNPPNRQKFDKNTLGLAKNHIFQSPAGMKYRQPQQDINVDQLERKQRVTVLPSVLL